MTSPDATRLLDSVYLYELRRHHASPATGGPAHEAAWQSTKHAMWASGLSILIELAGALLCAAIWGVGLVVT